MYSQQLKHCLEILSQYLWGCEHHLPLIIDYAIHFILTAYTQWELLYYWYKVYRPLDVRPVGTSGIWMQVDCGCILDISIK